MAMKAPAVQAQPQSTEHPHIVRMPGIAAGEPILKGSRVPVRAVVAVYDAISYYPDHQEEIEVLIEQNRLERVMEKHRLELGEKGQLIPKK